MLTVSRGGGGVKLNHNYIELRGTDHQMNENVTTMHHATNVQAQHTGIWST